MKPIALLFVIPLLAVVPVFRAVRRWCARDPHRRPWLIALSIVTLAIVGVLAPGVFALRPPFSESPAGLIVIFARGEALGILGTAALATIAAVAVPSGPNDRDRAP